MNVALVLGSTPPAPELVERLSAVLAAERPWQRITDRDRAALYFRARALAILAQAYDPEAQAALVEREEAEARRSVQPPSG